MSYLYALQHKPTGRFIPHAKGGSFAEPCSSDKVVPRFFHRQRDAKGFLTTWLKGPVVRSFRITWQGEEEYDIEHKPEYAKEPRVREEWQVVTVYWGVLP